MAQFGITVDDVTLDTNMQARGATHQTARAACSFLLKACISKLGLDQEEFLETVLADVRKAVTEENSAADS